MSNKLKTYIKLSPNKTDMKFQQSILAKVGQMYTIIILSIW